MKFVYFGDGIWGTKCLERLIADGHEPLAVVLRRNPTDDSLPKLAQLLGLPQRTPKSASANEFVEWVRSLDSELNISMSYNQILRKPLIESAWRGFINCHTGMLPNYRGRNVINWAIINDESEIGLTVHYVDEGIDTGDIILQRAIPIEWRDTYGTLLEKAQNAFPSLLSDAVSAIERNEVVRQPQAHLPGTYFAGRGDGDEWLDWSDTSRSLYNKVRAITTPGPGARTVLDDQEVVIWRARYDPTWPEYTATPGQVVGRWPGEGAIVKTGDSTLLVQQIQIGDEPAHMPDWRIGTRLGINMNSCLRQLEQRVKTLENKLEMAQSPEGVLRR